MGITGLRTAIFAVGIALLCGGGAHASVITLTGPTSTAGTYSPSTLAALGTANPSNVVNFGGLTGISLWGLLGGVAGSSTTSIITSTPAADNSKNAILRYYVLATGTNGAQTVVSLGQIDPMFGNPTNPPFVAYQNTGGALLTTPELVVPGGPSGSTLSSLMSLELLAYPALPTAPENVLSTSVVLSGNVNKPGAYTQAMLQNNFTPVQQTVSGDTYTGIPLLTFLNSNAPNINTQIVVGWGTDDYMVVYSLEELANLNNIITYASTGTDFTTSGDGVARTILPADNAHGRWLSNLADLVVLNASTDASKVATHDFNSDGISDVLWHDTANDVGMWLMDGGQILQTTTFTGVPPTWAVVGQRDFNNDGKTDLLWRDTSGNVGIWLMNGNQIASSSVLGNVPNTWSVVGTGNFNNNGFADILWRDNLGNVAIWFMNGVTIVNSAIVGNVPTQWVVAGADLHGDIFWRNTTTGEVGMWVMNGTQVAQAVDFGVVPLSWTIAGIGDFGGTGSFDVLWRDSLGNVGMWLMNGTQIMSTKVLGNVPLNWSIALTGDFNGDGMSDILWIDNLGNVAVWFMNGTTVSSVTTYGNVGTTWSVQSLNAD